MAEQPIITCANGSLRVGAELEPGQPLWRRVPSRGEDGHLLSDFMLIIPKLGRWPSGRLQQTLAEIQGVFHHYREFVVFADLNLKLNVLWVTVRPVPGIALELAAALRQRVPEAMLVANKAEAMLASRRS
jgi:hypothetical protein